MRLLLLEATSHSGLSRLLRAGVGVLERLRAGFLLLLAVTGENSLPVKMLLGAVSCLDRPGMWSLSLLELLPESLLLLGEVEGDLLVLLGGDAGLLHLLGDTLLE